MLRYVCFLQVISLLSRGFMLTWYYDFCGRVQMVWMCKEGLAAGIVTEDSDVVVYCLTAHVSCPVLVKLEDNGSAQVD